MTTMMTFVLFSAVLVLASMLFVWKSRMTTKHRVARFVREFSETIAPERESTFTKIRDYMKEELAEEELMLVQLGKELQFFTNFAADQVSQFFAKHRRALASGLFVGDAIAQTYFRSARADAIGWAGVMLIGVGVAVVLAGLGFSIALLTAMALKHRPAKAWRLLDWGAGVSGAFAVAAALALILTSGVQRESDAGFVLLLATYLTPLLLWGGVSSGLFAGTAFLQTADIRLTRKIRQHEINLETWRAGLEQLERLAAQLGLVVLLLVIGPSDFTSGLSELAGQELIAQEGPVKSAKGPVKSLERRGSGSAHSPVRPGLCAFIRDGSGSLDPAFASAALDSALLMLDWYARSGRCASVLVLTVTDDTSWAPRRWVALPAAGRAHLPCGSSQAASGRGEAAVTASLLNGLSPVIERAQEKRSAARCAEWRKAQELGYSRALNTALQEVRRWLQQVGNTEASSAVRGMLAFGSSSRFVATIILSDAIDTEDPPGPTGARGSADLDLVLTPAKSQYGGRKASLEAARRLAGEFPHLTVTPYVDVGALIRRR